VTLSLSLSLLLSLFLDVLAGLPLVRRFRFVHAGPKSGRVGDPLLPLNGKHNLDSALAFWGTHLSRFGGDGGEREACDAAVALTSNV